MDEVEVRASGPVFDGRAVAAMRDFADAAREEVAELARDQVLAVLDRSLREPTGHYESRVQVEQKQDDWSVTDDGVIYGGWLEGASSRNSRSTFKGYEAFQRATAETDKQAAAVAERVLKPYLRRMR